MYSSGYSQVSKYSPQSQKKMQYRSKGKSCGYYMRIIFFFSSLIQSLIIVSLVLFLVYGNTQDSASETRIQGLEESFSRLSLENVALRLQRKNLTNILNATLIEKAQNDFDLATLRRLCNISFHHIGNLERKLQMCTLEVVALKSRITTCIVDPPINPGGCNCGPLFAELKARYDLLETNFTQTVRRMTMEMDQIVKERDNLHLETIRLRRDKSIQEKELDEYKKNSKEAISNNFGYVKNVTRALREKIESFFPRHIAFQLTCPKQREHLEQIHTNCTNLSNEVEDKLQRYLDTVGEQMSTIYFDNNHLKAENWRLNDDYRWCSQNRTAMAEQHRRSTMELQAKYDKEKEQLLMDKMKLNGDKEVLLKQVKYLNAEVDHLKEKVRQLNMSCMMKPGGGGLQPNTNVGWKVTGGGSSLFSSTGFGQQGRTGSGSSLGSSFSLSKPGSTGTGSLASSYSSSGSSSSQSNTGFGMNKPGSTGTGSLASSYSSSGSSSSQSNTGFGMNKPGSTGTGSLGSSYSSSGSSSSQSNTGFGMNKPGSTGTGSLGSSYSSPGSSSSQSNTGFGMNKPGSTGTGSLGSSYPSSGSSSSQSNTGVNKPGSTGTGSLGSSYPSSGSSSSQSNTGVNKPGSTGTGSLGSSYPSSGSSSSQSNTGVNKPGSTGTDFLSSLFLSSGSSSSQSNTGFGMNKPGSGTSNSGQSKTGSTAGKTSSGSSYGGTGSYGGRSSGFVSGPGSVSQHLQDLQRYLNPPGPQEKQDLSRMLG